MGKKDKTKEEVEVKPLKRSRMGRKKFRLGERNCFGKPFLEWNEQFSVIVCRGEMGKIHELRRYFEFSFE